MALTPSTMLPLGTAAPDFSLPDTVSAQLAHGWHQLLSQGSSASEALSVVASRARQDGPLAQVAASALVCLGYGG